MNISKILVVEDDRDIQKVIRMSLKVGGVRDVVLANNGEECLAVVNDFRPDLILLDVTMTRLDGYQTCRLLKADAKTRSIPVIFLTAKTQQYEQDKGFAEGAIGYLTKPFDPLTLHKQIQAALENSNVTRTT